MAGSGQVAATGPAPLYRPRAVTGPSGSLSDAV